MTYPLKWKYNKDTRYLGYNVAFVEIFGFSVQIIYITQKNITHVKDQDVVINSLISNRWGEIYSDYLEYILPLGDDDYNVVNLLKYLATITVPTRNQQGYQLSHALCQFTYSTTYNFLCFPQHESEVAHVLDGIPCILDD